ncbi:MAG: methionine synthase [Proteobacteria bacterium]|nr:methionine synthase [Pseudomonadota bacterium]
MNDLIDAFVGMREEEVERITKEVLDKGGDPNQIIEAGKSALAIIGKRYEEGEAFIPELIMSGEMMGGITAQVKPLLKDQNSGKSLGKAVVGTVAGDIHDIGKDIVAFMLDVNGFEVTDLGVDVAPQAFIDTIQRIKPDVVGLSGLLTLAFDSMKNTIDAIYQAGLRDQVKIMIGGASIDEQVRAHTGADAYGRDAVEAVSLAKNWVGGN